MVGHMTHDGRMLARAGFLTPGLGPQGIEPTRSIPLFTRSLEGGGMSDDLRESISRIERAEFTGDIGSILAQLGQTMQQFERGISSSMTAFPVRENLEAEAKILVPLDTPVRNKLPRHGGAGKASAWKQATSLGGGWGTTYDQPGGVAATQAFFKEDGAPAVHTTVYADKTASYKLMGVFGSVTGFSMAAGKFLPA